MRITKLSLTNFRSFKETQTIEFAPVTLLFGANSVGKSTVLMAFFYIQQILAKGQCDPQRLDALGNKYVGGFNHLIHGKNINDSIVLNVEYDKQNKIGSTYNAISDLLDLSETGDIAPLIIDSVASFTDKVAVEFEISWSKTLNTAYVNRYSVTLNDDFIAEVTSDQGGKQPKLTRLNYFHPLLLPSNHDEWLAQAYEAGIEVHKHFEADIEALNEGVHADDEYESILGSPVHEYEDDKQAATSQSGWVSELHFQLNKSQSDNWQFDQVLDDADSSHISDTALHAPIDVKGANGALLPLGKIIQTTIDTDNDIVNHFVNELLSEVLVAPLDNLLSLLNDSLCIGPLRHIPDAQYQHNPYPEQKDWYDGKAAWDLIKKDKGLAFLINEWIDNKDRLALGYKLAFKVNDGVSRFVSASSPDEVEDIFALKDALGSLLKQSLSKENLAVNPDVEQTPFDLDIEIPNRFKGTEQFQLKVGDKEFHCASDLYLGGFDVKETEVTLWDTTNSIEVSPSDIGVGISQLFPLVTAALGSKKGIVACEQPELHVHPRVQVAIGDLLTQANNNVNFLIETHSEHIILRILRRIRQSTDGSLPKGLKPVSIKDISVVCLEQGELGVQTRRLKLTDDGDFEDEWPGGFFDERDEELF